MSLTCVLDLSVNISILAVSCNAFAVLFNSRAPVFAFVLIPERLIAIDFKPLPIRAGSYKDSFAPVIIAIESFKSTP